MKVIGFTGTQEGMTAKQYHNVRGILLEEEAARAVHGGCIGADTEFHRLCIDRRMQIVVWPSNKKSKQGDWSGAFLVHPEMDPLKRNPLIVNTATIMIVAPKEMQEIVRSGTWTTYRRARWRGIPRWLVYPDGTRKLEQTT